jgi:ABC-type bacteriocin/lantibiotic exporter with double-glycine peptidase domain
MNLRIVAIVLVCAVIFTAVYSSASEFTQEDRDRLIRMETTLQVFMQQVDKRFEQVDKRFDQMMTFLWILAGIFTALVAAVIGFAYWDRRTIIRRAKEEAMEDMKREGLLRSILEVLRDIAPDNVKLAEVLRKYNLL